MHHLVLVQILDSLKDLLYGMRSVHLREATLLANPVEQLSSCRKLGDDVVLVFRLEPVVKLDNVRVVEGLQHLELVVHYLVVALDVLLQDDLDGHLAVRGLCLSHDAICACTQRPAQLILAPARGLARVTHPMEVR